MGNITNSRTLTAENLLRLPSPIILLCPQRLDFEKAILDTGSHKVSLNLLLAKALIGKTEKERLTGITAAVLGLMPNEAAVYLTDYEMLFDPRYKLDVIKLFCEISRKAKLILKWCGGFNNGRLTYAEPDCDDYSDYKISDYKITCVI